MKTLLAILAAGVSLLGATSCADLGFGVDVDSGPYYNSTWYPNGYLGDYYWNTPVWNYGPVYNPIPPAPPTIVVPGHPVTRPPQVNRPPSINPGGPNGIGWNPGPLIRPGNNGLPTGRPIK